MQRTLRLSLIAASYFLFAGDQYDDTAIAEIIRRHECAGDGTAPGAEATVMMATGGTPLRVCYFNRSYWPDTTATGQLLTELAEDLVAIHGFEVTVVTGYPLGAEGLPARETRNGVRILRARGTRFSTRRFTGRAMNDVTYFASAFWLAITQPKPDIAIALTDPPIIGLTALAARPRHGMIFYCQEIFPRVAGLPRNDHGPLVDSLLEHFNRFVVRKAKRIVALGDTMASRLIHGNAADPAKVSIIHNWADTSAIVPSAKQNSFSAAHDLESRFVVLHAGNIGLWQNLDVVIETAGLLKDRTDIVILFIGDGNRKSDLQSAVAARGLTNVRFLPFQPRDQLRWTYASSDICLVSLKPSLAGYVVPSKLYPILAAGRPYIAAVEKMSEVAALTERHRCGVLVEPGDPVQMAEAILRLADQRSVREAMGTRSRIAAELFSRERQVAAHADVITEVASR